MHKKHENYHENLMINLRASSPFEGLREKSRAPPLAALPLARLLARSRAARFAHSSGELARGLFIDRLEFAVKIYANIIDLKSSAEGFLIDLLVIS